MTWPYALRRIAAGLACCVALAFAAKADDRAPVSPPSAQMVAHPGPCSLDLPSGSRWTETEKAVFFGLCNGWDDVINLSELDRDPLACNPHHIAGDVPAHRVLSGRFIEALGKNRALHETLTRSFIKIECAKIRGTINLDYLHIPFGLRIEQSWFTSPVSFYETRVAHTLSFEGSTFEASFNGDGMTVDGSVFLRGGATFKGEVKLAYADIDLTLEADGSTFEKPVNFERIKVGDYIFLRNGATFKGEVKVSNADIGGNLETTRSTFEGPFDGNGMRVGGSAHLEGGATFKSNVRLDHARIERNLVTDGSTFEGLLNGSTMRVDGSVFLRGGATFKGEVRLLLAGIGGNLEADGSTFEGRLNADSMQVDGSVFLRGGATFKGEVRLLLAGIGGNLSAIGSTFEGPFNGGDMRVGGSVLLRGGAAFKKEVRLSNAEISGNLDTDGSTFEGLFNGSGIRVDGSMYLRRGATFEGRVNLTIGRIGHFLQLGGGRFHDEIDMTGASIGGELLLSSTRFGKPQWNEGARLILRNVTTDILQAEMHAWKSGEDSWIARDLTGFRYDRLGGLHADSDSDNPNMANADASALIAWIRAAQPDDLKRHDTQPYEHLATVLTLQGAPDRAREVRYAMHDQHRQASDIPLSHKTALWALKTTVGYGLYPFRIVWWFLALVMLGALLGALSNSAALRDDRNWSQRWWSRLLFSLGNAFPLMSPIKRFDGIEHGSDTVELLFQLQRLLGFVIATIFVGALTLLAI